MMKRIFLPVILFFALAAIVLLALTFVFDNKKAPSSKEPKIDSTDLIDNSDSVKQDDKSDLIKIFVPQALENISSPLEIKGEVRGIWFFEASFPIKLVDKDGNEIATAIAQAEGDWMTEEFVPFSAQLNFFVPNGVDRGFLIFQKDNPSGLEEFNDEFRIPVELTQEKISLFVYFTTPETAGKTDLDCRHVEPVERQVNKTLAVGRVALEELIKGPTDAEKVDGFLSNINKNTKINSLKIENGVAKVDFSPDLEFQVGGSCLVSTIRAQIEKTLMQFETVDSVEISIDERTEDILQP